MPNIRAFIMIVGLIGARLSMSVRIRANGRSVIPRRSRDTINNQKRVKVAVKSGHVISSVTKMSSWKRSVHIDETIQPSLLRKIDARGPSVVGRLELSPVPNGIYSFGYFRDDAPTA